MDGFLAELLVAGLSAKWPSSAPALLLRRFCAHPPVAALLVRSPAWGAVQNAACACLATSGDKRCRRAVAEALVAATVCFKTDSERSAYVAATVERLVKARGPTPEHVAEVLRALTAAASPRFVAGATACVAKLVSLRPARPVRCVRHYLSSDVCVPERGLELLQSVSLESDPKEALRVVALFPDVAWPAPALPSLGARAWDVVARCGPRVPELAPAALLAACRIAPAAAVSNAALFAPPPDDRAVEALTWAVRGSQQPAALPPPLLEAVCGVAHWALTSRDVTSAQLVLVSALLTACGSALLPAVVSRALGSNVPPEISASLLTREALAPAALEATMHQLRMNAVLN